MAENEDSSSGIPRKSKFGKIYTRANIDETWLRAAYEGGASIQSCAEHLDVPPTTIHRRLKSLGVKAKPRGSWKAGRKKKLVREDDIRSLYVDQKLDISTCASRLGVSAGLIHRRMKEFGIASRPLGAVPRPGSPILDGVRPGDRDAYMKVWREKNGDRIIQTNSIWREANKNKVLADGRERGKKRYAENRSSELRKAKDRYATDPEFRAKKVADATASVKRRRAEDPEGFKAKTAAMVRERRATDVRFAIDGRMSNMIWVALKRGVGKNGRSWKTMVPYTIDELQAHLQTTLPAGFTWDDFLSGALHIDHRIPRTAFNYCSSEDYDFGRCWAMDNLQLLPARDNIRKSNKLSEPFQPTLL